MYFDGTAEEWEAVNVGSGNDPLPNATIHFLVQDSFTVTFVNYDGTVLKTETVKAGEGATAPATPNRAGHTFSGWDVDFSNISADLMVTAQFTAITEPAFIVSSTTATPGEDSVIVTVSIVNNPGILGMTLSLSYDESAMTLVGSSNGDAVSSLTMTQPSRFKNGCDHVWYAEKLSAEDVQDGTVLTLEFAISETAAVGNYPIAISYLDGNIFDLNLSSLSLDVIDGGIAVAN